MLAGRTVVNAETEVDGCPITFPKQRKPKEVTYAGNVAPILQKHCCQCHRGGGSAPFSLTSYKLASARAEIWPRSSREQRMPPWFASEDFGPFVNRRGLSDEDRATVIDWVRAGTPPGDIKKVPAPTKEPHGTQGGSGQMADRHTRSGFAVGRIDVARRRRHPIPIRGFAPCFPGRHLDPGAQILPDNPRVLHHGNLGYGNLVEGFKEENFITGTVPGGEPMDLDRGIAYCIPKGSVLALQLHFVATGKPEKCRVSVGLRYPREVVQKRLRSIQLTDHKFAIPPGAPAHKVAASRMLDSDVLGVGLFSHMHLRGKDMTFTAHLPDGKTDTLLIIPNYNFSWQLPYRWETGKMRLPKGTRLECVAHYDNSPFNPYNPNPLATVRNGPQTYQEMMYGFFFYTGAEEKLGLRIDTKTGTVVK